MLKGRTREASAIWAHKSRDFQAAPLPMARIMDLPPSKLCKSNDKRYIGKFMYMIFAR
jgi:hypothetical protein